MSEDIYGTDSFGKDFWALVEEVEKQSFPKITEEAIRNIPFVHYPEIKEEESYYIYKLEKLLLKLAKEENDSREAAFVYNMKASKKDLNLDKYNKQCMAYAFVKGSESEVDISGDRKANKLINSTKEVVLVSMHNHPNNTTFSLNDCAFFLRNRNIKIFIDIHQNGIVEYMARTSKFNEQDAIRSFVGLVRDGVNQFIIENKDELDKRIDNKDVLKNPISFIKNNQYKRMIPSYIRNDIVNKWIEKDLYYGLRRDEIGLSETPEDEKQIKKLELKINKIKGGYHER